MLKSYAANLDEDIRASELSKFVSSARYDFAPVQVGGSESHEDESRCRQEQYRASDRGRERLHRSAGGVASPVVGMARASSAPNDTPQLP